MIENLFHKVLKILLIDWNVECCKTEVFACLMNKAVTNELIYG